MKPDRLDQAARRVCPPQERFGADDGAGLEVEDRLVVHDELVALERAAKLRLELEALRDLVDHRVVEEVPAGLPVLLRLVHRGVGVAEQHHRIGVLGRVGLHRHDADAHRQHRVVAVEHDRRLDRVADLLGDPGGVVDRLQSFAEDHELVAAGSRDGVRRASRAGEAVRDLDQHVVAGRVAEGVVHPLELVEVAEEQRQHVARSRGVRERDVEAVHQRDAVRQPGERVAKAQVDERFGRLPARGHVAGVGHDAVHDRIVEHLGRRRLEPVPSAVAVAEPQLDRRLRKLRRHDEPADQAVVHGEVGRVDQVALVRPGELGRQVAERALDRGAAVGERAVDVGDEHDVAHAGEQRLVPVLARLIRRGRGALRPLVWRSRRLDKVPIVRFPHARVKRAVWQGCAPRGLDERRQTEKFLYQFPVSAECQVAHSGAATGKVTFVGVSWGREVRSSTLIDPAMTRSATSTSLRL